MAKHLTPLQAQTFHKYMNQEHNCYGEALLRVARAAEQAEKMFDAMAIDDIHKWLGDNKAFLYASVHMTLNEALAALPEGILDE